MTGMPSSLGRDRATGDGVSTRLRPCGAAGRVIDGDDLVRAATQAFEGRYGGGRACRRTTMRSFCTLHCRRRSQGTVAGRRSARGAPGRRRGAPPGDRSAALGGHADHLRPQLPRDTRARRVVEADDGPLERRRRRARGRARRRRRRRARRRAARATAACDAVTLATRTAGGNRSARRSASSAAAYSGCCPGRERRGERAADADEDTGAPGRRQRRGVRPPPQAVLADPQRLAQQHPLAVEQEHRPVAARRRSARRRGSRPRARARRRRAAPVARRRTRMTRDAGERAAELLGRAARADGHARRSFVPSQIGQRQALALVPHQHAARRRRRRAARRADRRSAAQRAGSRQSAHASTGA